MNSEQKRNSAAKPIMSLNGQPPFGNTYIQSLIHMNLKKLFAKAIYANIFIANLLIRK